MSLARALLIKTSDTAFAPTDLSNLDFWFNPRDSSSVTLSGSNITQIVDKGPNAYTGVPGSGFTGPQIASSYRNGMNAIQMTNGGNLDFAGTTTMVASGVPYHLFMFINSGNFSSSSFPRVFNLSSSISTFGYFSFFSNNGSYAGFNVGMTGVMNFVNGPAAPIGTDCILEIQWDGTSLLPAAYQMIYNGTTVDTVVNNPGGVPQELNNSIGSPDPEAMASINGVLGDYLKYSRILTSGERADVISYLKTAWNL